MKFFALATALFALAVAAADKKNYIITFAKDTPQSVVDDAMDKVIAEGGQITHKYSLIRGFAFLGSESSASQVKAMDAGAVVEEDKEVHIMNDDF